MALETAAVILLIHMLLLKKTDWGSELSRTRGDHRLLSLFCGGEQARARARTCWSGRRERRGGREEESDTCRGIDFNSGSPFLKYSPGLRGCPQWLILGLARALLSLSTKSSTQPRNRMK